MPSRIINPMNFRREQWPSWITIENKITRHRAGLGLNRPGGDDLKNLDQRIAKLSRAGTRDWIANNALRLARRTGMKKVHDGRETKRRKKEGVHERVATGSADL